MAEKEPGVAAVERALTILGAFSATDSALSLHELANRTGLHKSTILRILGSLNRHHCVLRRADEKYQLGPMLLHWGSIYRNTLRLEDHILPVLQQLAQDTGESASFYIREQSMRVCLFRVDSVRSVRDHVRVGDLLPLDRGAAGHVLTRFDSGDSKEPWRGQSPIVVTFAEQDPDAAGIAAPIFGPGTSLRGAISLSGPLSRFTADVIPRMSSTVREAAIGLTNRLGGNTSLLTADDSKSTPITSDLVNRPPQDAY